MVDYDGEQLWQRIHDDVEITLLRDDFEGIKIRRRLRSAMDSNIKRSLSMGANNKQSFGSHFRPGEVCAAADCGRVVFQADFVAALGKQYCKGCFRCTSCNRRLLQSDFHVSRDMQQRCGKCHREFELK